MNFAIYLVSEFLSRLIPFLSIFIVAYFVDVANFGILTLYVVSYEILLIVISNNINAVNKIYFFKNNESYIDKTISQLKLSLLICLIFISIILVFVSSKGVFLILSIAAFIKCIPQIALSYFQCSEDAKSYVLVNLGYVVIFNVVFLISVLINGSISYWALSILIATIFQLFVSLKLLPFNVKAIFCLNQKNMFNRLIYLDGLMLMPQAIGFWLKMAIDRIIVKISYTDFEVGLIGFIFQLSLPLIILANVINLYETPKTNNFIKQNNRKKIVKRLYINILFIFIFSILIYIVSSYVIDIFFIKYIEVYKYLEIAIFSMLIYSCFLITTNTFYYIDMKFFISKMVFFSTLIQIIVSIYANKFYGLYGLFLSSTLINTAILLYSYSVLTKKL